jgi:hypothetical protein
MAHFGVSMLDFLWDKACPEDTSIADHILLHFTELLKAYPGDFRKLREYQYWKFHGSN